MPISISYRIIDRINLSLNVRDAIALIIWWL
jgi:hypothetical protein